MRIDFRGSRVLNFHDQPHHVQRVIMSDNGHTDWAPVLAVPSRRFDVVWAIGAWWVVSDFTDVGHGRLTMVTDMAVGEQLVVAFGWDADGHYHESVYLLNPEED